MLESIREGVKKPWVKIVVFAIVISFVFAGYFTSSFFLGDPNAVAIVNGESISRVEFQSEYQRTKVQQADYYNANVKTEEQERAFQEQVLQTLIDQKVREQAARQLGLTMSNEELRGIIQNSEFFKDSEGNYSPELVNRFLAQRGKSREWLKSAFVLQETMGHLTSGVIDTEFNLPKEARAEYEIMAQKRSGKVLKLDFEKFKQGLDISEEDISQYYTDNQEAFRIEEKVSVEYIELSIDKLMGSQNLLEEEISTFYQDNLNRYQSEAQKQFSHILVLNNDDKDAAKAKIEAIKQKLANGEDFNQVGESDADEVGDLGVLLEGVLEPAAEEAVKDISEVGKISEVVEIEDGFQILKLTNLVAGEVQPLEQVKEEIVSELKRQKAEEEFYTKSELLKEKTFEFSDSLKEAAEATGVAITTSELFGLSARNGIFANQQVKDSAFSTDVKDNLLNSQPLEIGENHLVVLRLKEHKPSEIQALETVKERVKNDVTQKRAKQVAGDLANDLIAKLKGKEDVAELLAENQLTWTDLDAVERNNAALSYMTSQKFFKMAEPAEGEVSYDMAEDFQGFVVLMLNSVEKGNWDSAEESAKKQRELFVNRYFANAVFSAFFEEQRLKAEVRRNLDNIGQL